MNGGKQLKGWNLQYRMGDGQDGVSTQSYYCSKSQVPVQVEQLNNGWEKGWWGTEGWRGVEGSKATDQAEEGRGRLQAMAGLE